MVVWFGVGRKIRNWIDWCGFNIYLRANWTELHLYWNNYVNFMLKQKVNNLIFETYFCKRYIIYFYNGVNDLI